MAKITKKLVDIITPEHDRTSCSDENLANSSGGWFGKYDENTGRKVIHFPRCHRCYLLKHIGKENQDLEFKLELALVWQERIQL